MATEEPGAKAVLGIVVTVAGGLLLFLVQQGYTLAFDIFLVLSAWVICKFTGWANPWGAAAAVTVGVVAYELFH